MFTLPLWLLIVHNFWNCRLSAQLQWIQAAEKAVSLVKFEQSAEPAKLVCSGIFESTEAVLHSPNQADLSSVKFNPCSPWITEGSFAMQTTVDHTRPFTNMPAFCSNFYPEATPRSSPRRLFDAFLFANEVEIVRMRMYELKGVADYHLAFESHQTMMGAPSTPHFMSHFSDVPNVRHLVTNLTEKYARRLGRVTCGEGLVRQREASQRSMLLQALFDWRKDDVIYYSDADELISRDAALALKWCDGLEWPLRIPTKTYHYHLGCVYDTYSLAPFAVSGEHLFRKRAVSICHMRSYCPIVKRPCNNRGKCLNSKVHNPCMPSPRLASRRLLRVSAWHLSYFFSVDLIRRKLMHSRHQELNTPEINNVDHITRCLRNCDPLSPHMFGGIVPNRTVNISFLPLAVLHDPKRYKHYLPYGMYEAITAIPKHIRVCTGSCATSRQDTTLERIEYSTTDKKWMAEQRRAKHKQEVAEAANDTMLVDPLVNPPRVQSSQPRPTTENAKATLSNIVDTRSWRGLDARLKRLNLELYQLQDSTTKVLQAVQAIRDANEQLSTDGHQEH